MDEAERRYWRGFREGLEKAIKILEAVE